jgi:CRP-like cAMP-binding protein
VRGADVTALKDLLTIRIEVAALHAASATCQHSFDRAFIQILLERLQLANQRITG